MATKTKIKRRENPARKANNGLTKKLLETARDMYASGLMTKRTHEKIVARHRRATT